MSVLYRVHQRTASGEELIAEIRDGVFAGKCADFVRQQLEYWGYPKVPLEKALELFRFANSPEIRFERISLVDHQD